MNPGQILTEVECDRIQIEEEVTGRSFSHRCYVVDRCIYVFVYTLEHARKVKGLFLLDLSDRHFIKVFKHLSRDMTS